jgi:hypothetical protein
LATNRIGNDRTFPEFIHFNQALPHYGELHGLFVFQLSERRRLVGRT